MSMRGGFRPDLFYRLAVIPIVIPPLREHREDIPEYVDHFVAKYARDLRRNATSVSPAAMAKLAGYDWPGNIRELSNALEYAVNLATGAVIDTDCLPCQVLCPPSADAALGSGSVPCSRPDLGSDRDGGEYPIGHAAKRGMTRSALEDALERYGTSTRAKEAIAAAFGVSRATLYRRLREYGL